MSATHYSKSFELNDGRLIRLRSISPDDRQKLLQGFHQLSQQSVYYRFFSAKHNLDEHELDYLTNIDFDKHVGIGAALLVDGEEIPVAVGRYIVLPDAVSAELSITVQDRYQHQGIGSLLLQQLVIVARKRGITRLIANVLSANRHMLALLNHSGLKLESRQNHNMLRIEIDLTDPEVLH